MIKKGDSVRYLGRNVLYPVDSVIAERYCDKKSIYMVTWIGGKPSPHKDIKLAGIAIPLISVLFEKVGVE